MPRCTNLGRFEQFKKNCKIGTARHPLRLTWQCCYSICLKRYCWLIQTNPLHISDKYFTEFWISLIRKEKSSLANEANIIWLGYGCDNDIYAITSKNADKHQNVIRSKHFLIIKYGWQRKYTSAYYIVVFFSRQGLDWSVVSEHRLNEEREQYFPVDSYFDHPVV